ncbi:MAG: diaminopimelate epimerase [Candidatus Thorarchaeota archaeon SMTZ1-83]
MKFAKLQCGGNDFILLDLGQDRPTLSLRDLAKRMCKRRLSVGADGLLGLETERNSAFSLRYFNRDGSETQFCGNGILCAAQWIHETGDRRNPIEFRWGGARYKVWMVKGRAQAELPQARNVELDMHLQLGGVVSYVVIGVPHVVTFEDELEHIDVNRLGRKIRSDPSLSPEGANVDFCQVVGSDRIRVRTYERGVESETLSCGSGAAAAFYIAHRRGMVGDRVKVSAPAAKTTISVDRGQMVFEGKPVLVYSGVLEQP